MNLSLRAKPEMDPVERESREIERRRQRYADRTKRILHAKTRIIGIDTQALSQQVQERQERERLELERNMFYDDESKRHSQLITESQNAAEAEKRKELDSLHAFRLEQSRDKKTRQLVGESGVNNMADFDTNFLKFEGEDLDKANRTRAQHSQQADWLRQQVAQREEKERREREENSVYNSTQSTISDIQRSQDDEAARVRADELEKMLEHNRQLAAEKKARERRDAQLNQKANDEEVARAYSSRFLNETTGSGVLPSQFKGFSTAQRQAILDEQKAQQDELKRKREQELQENADYLKQQEDIRREIIRQDRARLEQAARERQSLTEERKVQQKDKDLRTQYLNNVVYTNPVQDSFFNQFGTSCR